MQSETDVLRVYPGDEIEWEVEIRSQSRLREVGAIFVEEDESSEPPLQLVLVGEVYRFEKTTDRRVNFATLRFSEERSNRLVRGTTYRLVGMGGITSSERQLDIPPQTLPEAYISILDEPEGEVLRLGDSRMRIQ